MEMKQLTQTPPTWQKKATPLLGLLFIFSGWGYSTQAIAASVDAAIPQESLFEVITLITKITAQFDLSRTNQCGKMKACMSYNSFTLVFYIKHR